MNENHVKGSSLDELSRCLSVATVDSCGECVTNVGVSLWCCTEDGSRPPGVGFQEQASNHPMLLRPKGVVVSDRGKGIC
jgi:hypothetical protein